MTLISTPTFVRAVLDDLDGRASAFHERDVAGDVRAVWVDDIQGDDRRACATEWSAFSFVTSGDNRDSGWDSYFRPHISLVRQGEDIHVPDPHLVDRDQIDYWSRRADEVKHPVLRARYSDLVWELSRAVGVKPDVRRARDAVDAYVAASAMPWDDPDGHQAFVQQWLRRARDVALGIGDKTRTGDVVAAMFGFFERAAVIDKIGTWAFINDDVLEHPKITLNDLQIKRVIEYMEQALALMTNPGDPQHLSPHVAGSIALRLERHYRRKGLTDDIKRVVLTYGRAFEYMAMQGNAMLALAWLQPLRARYQQEGLQDDARRVQLLLKEKGEGASAEMVRMEVPVPITREELQSVASKIITGSTTQALEAIANRFQPDPAALPQLLEWGEANGSLLQRIGVKVVADAQMVASAGSVELDEDRRVRHEVARQLALEGLLLDASMDLLIERGLSTDDLLQFVYVSPLADEARRKVLETGLQGYLSGDDISAIHVLLPQLEHLLRRLLARLGQPTSKPVKGQPELLQEVNWNDIVSHETVRAAMPSGLRLYLAVYFADPIALNLRNRVLHGLVDDVEFDHSKANRTVHALLATAAWTRDYLASAPATPEIL